MSVVKPWTQDLRDRIGVVNSWLLVALGFVLPISVALANIFAFLNLFLWLVKGGHGDDWQKMKRNPVVLAISFFYGLHIVGMAWTRDTEFGIEVLLKESLLLLLPVLMFCARREHLKYYVSAFLAAMAILVIYSFLVRFGVVPPGEGMSVNDPAPVMGHISYNVFLTIASYLLLYIVLFGKDVRKWLRVAASVSLMAFTVNMFITQGRAGQVMFFAMIALTIFQYFRGRALMAAIVSAVTIPILFTTLYTFNEAFHVRVSHAISGVQNYSTDKTSSSGERIAMLVNSLEIFSHHPLLGAGTGDFKNEYALVNARNSPELQPTIHPHNMFALELAQLGIVGFASLVGILVAQVLQARRSRLHFQRSLGLVIPVLYAVIMLSDSYLRGHFTTMLFVYLSAFAYAGFAADGESGPGLLTQG